LGNIPASRSSLLLRSRGHTNVFTPAAPPAGPTPVARWRFDETSGTTFVDAIAGRNGTFVGTPQYAQPGLSATSGASCGFIAPAYGTIPHNSAFDLSEGSLTLLVQPDAVAGQRDIWTNDVASGGGPGSFSIEIVDGKLRAYTFDGALHWLPSPTGGGTILPGTAYRITLTFGPRGSELWLNTTLLAADTTNTSGIAPNSQPFTVMAFPGPVVNCDGLLDSAELWGVQLSATEIAALPAPVSAPRNNLVSRYLLDDSAIAPDNRNLVAGVLGSGWQQLGTIVAGIDSSSLYKNGGTAQVSLPGGNSLHAFSDMTISFYFEPASLLDRDALFVCGDGSAAGDFSIERLGSKLRAWIMRDATTVDYFESTDGIAATDFVVGTAVRIAMSLGSGGAKMYFNNTLVASIPANTNPWNNSRTKRIGIWDDGSQIPMRGVVDHVRIWNYALTTPQIQALEAPTNVTLPATPVAGTRPIVPRLDGFLPNDDMTNLAALGSRFIYVEPNGVGNGSQASPGNIFTALSGGYGGTPTGGTVIVCRQGYYGASGGITVPGGSSATNPVTIVAFPGEWATFCQDIDLIKVPNMPSAPGRGSQVNWELCNFSPFTGYNVWRVPYTQSTQSLGTMSAQGVWMDQGVPFLLLEYEKPFDMITFPGGQVSGSTRDSNSRPISLNNWWGPGVAVGDSGGGTSAKQYLYMRFDRPNWTDIGYIDPTTGAWPDDGRWNVATEGQNGVAAKWIGCRGSSNAPSFWNGRPILPNPLNETPINSQGDLPSGRNPNQCRIYVARINSTAFLSSSTGQFVRIGSGINTLGYYAATNNPRNQEWHRGIDWCQVSFAMGTSQLNWTVHRRRIFCGTWRLHASMGAKKYNDQTKDSNNNYVRPAWELKGVRSHNELIQSQNSTSVLTRNVTFDNCTLHGWHEIIANTAQWRDMRFVNCVIAASYDEFFQSQIGSQSNFEVGYCYLLDAVFLMSSAQNGVDPNQSPWCTTYFHHNIGDNRCPRGSAPAFGGNNTINGGATAVHRQPGSGYYAYKMYNNTYIQAPDNATAWDPRLGFGADINNGLTGLGQAGGSRRGFDECFNNILVVHDSKRYTNSEASIGRLSWVDALEYGAPFNFPNHCLYRDYNCYSRHGLPFRPGSGSYTNPKCWMTGVKHSGAVQQNASFEYYRNQPAGEPGGAVFVGSSLWNAFNQPIPAATGVKLDQNSVDDNPQIPSCMNITTSRTDYRPQNVSKMGANATPPSGFNWWGSPGWTSYGATPVPFNMAPSPWKGALDPNGTTCPIGVQNP
jgi:concanavalin A-like lectin/glucanase superfamily protein